MGLRIHNLGELTQSSKLWDRGEGGELLTFDIRESSRKLGTTMATSLPEAATSGEEDQRGKRGNEKKKEKTIESEPRFPKKNT
jgi:hypothetical protein